MKKIPTDKTSVWKPLSPELRQRVENYYSQLHVFFDFTLEDAIVGFEKDLDPEWEIAFWEKIARAYTGFIQDGNFTLKKRQQIFGVLFAFSTSKALVANNLIPNIDELTSFELEMLRNLYLGVGSN